MTESVAPEDMDNWPSNYFNYFTEIEEHFQRARGTSLFLLSPLDWALIESWQASGVPLEAVLRGIDDAFEKWRSRKVRVRQVNSLAYCSQAITEAAKRLADSGSLSRKQENAAAPLQVEEIRNHLTHCREQIGGSAQPLYSAIADSLGVIANDLEERCKNLEDLERHLTALEEKMVAITKSAMPDTALLEVRRQLDSELSPYRNKMTADQIAMLERRFIDSRLLELAGMPRLSLFHIH